MKVDQESFVPKSGQKSNKRKKGGKTAAPETADGGAVVDEEAVRVKLSDHFLLVNEMEENERLRRELERTKLGLQLYKEYKKQKKQKTK